MLIDTNDVDVRDVHALDDIALELRRHRAVVAVTGLNQISDLLVETFIMRQGARREGHSRKI